MAAEIEVLDAVYAELQTVLANSSHVAVSSSDAEDHTGLLERHDGETYPYIGIERFGTTEDASAGIGGDSRVVDQTYDDSGYITDQTTRSKRGLVLSVAALVDDSDVRTTSLLLSDVESHFDQFTGSAQNATALHSDVKRMNYDSRRDVSRPEDHVVGERVRYNMVYVRDDTESVTPIESVSIDLVDDATDVEYPVTK